MCQRRGGMRLAGPSACSKLVLSPPPVPGSCYCFRSYNHFFFLQLSLPSLYSSSKFTTKTLIISSSSLAFFSIRNTQSLIWDLLDNLELSFSLFLFDIVFVGSVSSTICLHLLGAFPPLLLKSAKWTPYYICFLFLHLLPLNLIDLASSKLGYFS